MTLAFISELKKKEQVALRNEQKAIKNERQAIELLTKLSEEKIQREKSEQKGKRVNKKFEL